MNNSIDESKKFRVAISARHLHLTQETVDILFGQGHAIEPEVPTNGQFCSTTRATVVGPKKTFERVAVMGPCREFNQFEISMTDARDLGISAAVRMSGDIKGTPGIKIIGTVGEVTLEKGVIIAKRHIHMNPVLAEEFGVKDGECVLLRVESEDRSLIFDDTIAHVGKNPNSGSVAHIDTDEGNAAGVKKGTLGYIVKSIE
jgi:propanediol utilization protein